MQRINADEARKIAFSVNYEPKIEEIYVLIKKKAEIGCFSLAYNSNIFSFEAAVKRIRFQLLDDGYIVSTRNNDGTVVFDISWEG